MSIRNCCVLIMLTIATPLISEQVTTEEFSRLSRVFRAAADRVRPSMVTIETRGGVRSGKKQSRGIFSRLGDGRTTGLVIASDGLILTSSYNLVDRPTTIIATTATGSQHVAKIIGDDPNHMVTVLKIRSSRPLPTPPIAKPGSVKVGQWAIAMGTNTMSPGIVSATQRINGTAIQTDANINPGNYGGPLLNIDGEVLGLCVPLARKQDPTAGVDLYDSGVGFAIPINRPAWLRRIMSSESTKRKR